MSCKRLFSLLVLVLTLSGASNFAFAKSEENPAVADAPAPEEKKSINLTELVFGHVADSHEWHFFELNDKPVAISLPVIIYSDKGVEVFSSSHFEEWKKNADGVNISNSYAKINGANK